VRPAWWAKRFIQLLENHPWFEVAWIAASDRSSGKTYAEAAKWRLDSALPERIAEMALSPATPEGAPEDHLCVGGRSLRTRAGARLCRRRLRGGVELERLPHDAQRAFGVARGKRRPPAPDRAAVVAQGFGRLHCNQLELHGDGPVLALKPLDDRFGVEQIFATSMQAVSGAGYPGVRRWTSWTM